MLGLVECTALLSTLPNSPVRQIGEPPSGPVIAHNDLRTETQNQETVSASVIVGPPPLEHQQIVLSLRWPVRYFGKGHENPRYGQ